MFEQRYSKVTIIVDDGDKVTRYYFKKTRDTKMDVEFHEPEEWDFGFAKCYKPLKGVKSMGIKFVPEADEKTGNFGTVRVRNKRKKN